MLDVSNKYAWVKPLKGKTILNVFIGIINGSNHKPEKLWVYQGIEFYNNKLNKNS